MTKHERQFHCDPIDDGLTEEDRRDIAADAAAEIRAGKLVNGICPNCKENYSQVIGQRECWWCAGGY